MMGRPQHTEESLRKPINRVRVILDKYGDTGMVWASITHAAIDVKRLLRLSVNEVSVLIVWPPDEKDE